MSEQQGIRASPVNRLSPDDPSAKEDEELAALGGGTRLVSRKSPSVPSSPQGAVPSVEIPPMQPVPMVSPVAQETPDPNSAGTSSHSQSPTTVWSYGQQPQPAEMYDFGAYNMAPEQWQADPGYSQMDPGAMHIDVMPMHYGMYGQAPPLSTNGYTQMQSPLDSPVHARNSHADPDASWRSLFAQFNQA